MNLEISFKCYRWSSGISKKTISIFIPVHFRAMGISRTFDIWFSNFELGDSDVGDVMMVTILRC